MPDERSLLRPGTVLQVDPTRDVAFGACFAVVTQVRPWGVIAEVPIPDIAGSRAVALRLTNGTFAPIGPVRFRFEPEPRLSPEPAAPHPDGERRRFVERMDEWRRTLGWDHSRFATYLQISRNYWWLLRSGQRELTVGVAQRVLRERPELEHYLVPAIRDRAWGKHPAGRRKPEQEGPDAR